jgi:hypothetical protein
MVCCGGVGSTTLFCGLRFIDCGCWFTFTGIAVPGLTVAVPGTVLACTAFGSWVVVAGATGCVEVASEPEGITDLSIYSLSSFPAQDTIDAAVIKAAAVYNFNIILLVLSAAIYG